MPHHYFSSFNQSDHCFLPKPLPKLAILPFLTTPTSLKESWVLKVFIWVTFPFGILQILGKCYFCWGKGWNMPRTACCKQPRHDRCEKRYKRTLASYTRACGYCRGAFEDPCDPLTQARMDDKMALYQRDVSKDISQWFVTVEIWLEVKARFPYRSLLHYALYS